MYIIDFNPRRNCSYLLLQIVHTDILSQEWIFSVSNEQGINLLCMYRTYICMAVYTTKSFAVAAEVEDDEETVGVREELAVSGCWGLILKEP